MSPITVYRRGRFSIPVEAGEAVFDGYIAESGTGVGNFDAPLFDLETAKKICEVSLLQYDESRDAFIDYHDLEGDVYPAVLEATVDGPQVLYQVGGGGWVWEEVKLVEVQR